MSKRVMFIGLVILVVSSAASAGVWDWLFGIPMQNETANSQQQAFYGNMGQVGLQIGAGSSSGTNGGSTGMTQTKVTPRGAGVQGTHVVGAQSTYISTGPGSLGVTYQQAEVFTWQGQWF